MDYGRMSYFEHTFWLQIMGDHARFIFHTLSPSETENIHQAHHFMQVFDHLLEQARNMEAASQDKWIELSHHVYSLTEQFRQYKLLLISAQLECKLKIGLPPTLINHMVNEIEEYMRILSYLVKGEVPPKIHPVHHHNVWLLDAAGHASVIKAELDPVEKKLMQKADEFEKTFEHFFIKSKEMAGFIRARQDLFPALRQFNKETSLEIELFYGFVKEIEEMRLDCTALGTIMPLLVDHMAREECYYLTKLHEIDPENVKMTSCDPTKPRVEGG